MSHVASLQLATHDALGGTVQTLYTVPTGKRTIVKSIVTTNLDSSARIVIFYVTVGSTEEASFNVHEAASGAAGDTVILAPWIVLEAGQSLKAQTTGGTSRVIVSGAELTL